MVSSESCRGLLWLVGIEVLKVGVGTHLRVTRQWVRVPRMCRDKILSYPVCVFSVMSVTHNICEVQHNISKPDFKCVVAVKQSFYIVFINGGIARKRLGVTKGL